MKNFFTKQIIFVALASLSINPAITGIKKEEKAIEHNKGLFERGEGYWTSPNDEAKKDFFGKLTDPKSQRENWYKVTPYVAEFACAVSNIGFLYVGLKHQSPALLFAGTASIVSHSIPKQWLLTVDKLGVLLVLVESAKNYQTILNNPWLVAPLALAGTINATDAYLARNKGKTWPHVVWHLTVALVADVFLTYSQK